VREFDDEFAGASSGWKELLEVIRRMHKEVFGRDEFNAEVRDSAELEPVGRRSP